MLLLAVYIVVASIVKLVSHQGADPPRTRVRDSIRRHHACLSRTKRGIGTEKGGKALRSDGSCSIVCAYMSWVLISRVVLTAILGWWWIDSITALSFYYAVREGWEAVEAARGKEDACGSVMTKCIQRGFATDRHYASARSILNREFVA